jgi:hypothetical protein
VEEGNKLIILEDNVNISSLFNYNVEAIRKALGSKLQKKVGVANAHQKID